MINGYSGFFPDSWVTIKKSQQQIDFLPQVLISYNVDTVIIAKKDSDYINVFYNSNLYDLEYIDDEYKVFVAKI